MKKVGMFLAIVVFMVLLLQFDYTSFWDSMKQVSILAFSGLLLLQIISQLLVNYQWCRIGKMMGGSYEFTKMLYVNARGMIIECITPGVKIGGEVTRAILLKKEMGYRGEEAAALVAIQKMVSLSSFFMINLVALIHISGKISFLQEWWVKGVVYTFLFLIMAIFAGVFFFSGSWKTKIESLSPEGKWKKRFVGFLSTLLTHAQTLKTAKGELYKQLLLSLLIWILFPLKMVILVGLFTPNYDAVYLTEVTFISYMVGMIPLLPGGMGSFEVTMTGLLLLMELPAGEAAAITLLFRFNTFWFVILISLLFVGAWKIRGRKLEQKSN